ncbi:hypothetical protein BP00DRAFT_429957 [Aspergillus indologenus CBS 114.80]|uniref:Uncharacterized protein n=1 Tax=Aspergillus indologenus CBS 114.80 TaxID=1450541 RepID=A0A2V5HQX9_9EURO|nr:hypothetical protein BP00DRAFT_429957 [Aspergillus indologenus CBS 114.80]
MPAAPAPAAAAAPAAPMRSHSTRFDVLDPPLGIGKVQPGREAPVRRPVKHLESRASMNISGEWWRGRWNGADSQYKRMKIRWCLN